MLSGGITLKGHTNIFSTVGVSILKSRELTPHQPLLSAKGDGSTPGTSTATEVHLSGPLHPAITLLLCPAGHHSKIFPEIHSWFCVLSKFKRQTSEKEQSSQVSEFSFLAIILSALRIQDQFLPICSSVTSKPLPVTPLLQRSPIYSY